VGISAEASVRREQRAWFVYDWANSAYASTVVTLFLGPYLTAVAKAGAGPDGYIHPFGVTVDPRSLWGYLVSISVLSQVLVLPLVGAIADYGRRKREILGALAYTGAIATMGLFFVEGSNYLLGAALFLVANLSFGASMVVYNAFLPEIAAPEERDSVSSKGWGVGYLGGGLLLALNLAFLSNAEKLGITKGMAVRISMGSAGLWWALFTLVPLAVLRNRGAQRALPAGETIFGVGFRQFRHTVAGLRRYPKTLLFLAAYLTYNDAIQTVIAMAGQFGSDDLKMPMEQLTLAILMVQDQARRSPGGVGLRGRGDAGSRGLRRRRGFAAVRCRQAHLRPHDQVQADTLGLGVRPDHTRQRALVSDGQCGVAQRVGALHQFLRMRGTGEKAEVAAAVQLGVSGGHGRGGQGRGEYCFFIQSPSTSQATVD